MIAIRVRRIVVGTAAIGAALFVTASASRLAARGGAQQPDAGIAPSALAQIEALVQEKETRTPAERKIDSQLLYARRMQLGVPIAPGVRVLEIDLPQAADGHVIVDVKARITGRLMVHLNGLSAEMKQTGDADLQLHVDLDQIEAIAEQPDVVYVGPQQRAFTSGLARPVGRRVSVESAQQADPGVYTDVVGTGQGSVSSQGDVVHRSAVFRGTAGVNGAGVKIGVLSDGVEHLADAQRSGNLGAVTVLPGQAGSGDEGTAMLEVIHDMAPGAQLYFATATTSITSFAANIRALRAAGCDIIVDDVGYLVESPFQDGQGPSVVSPTNAGAIAQAVKEVAATGALYFSSAGNAGNLNDGTSGVWEGDFSPGAAAGAPLLTAGTVHRFSGSQDFNVLSQVGSSSITLFWSDPLGASANDYDLFRLNSTGTALMSASTNIQDGNDDPFESAFSAGTGSRIVIVKKASAAGRFLHLNTNRGRLSVATAGQTHGHATTSSPFSFSVAATNANTPFPNAFSTSNVVESFSSDGPRRLFFNADGLSITPGNVSSTGGVVLQKPDLTAADGVSVSGAGLFGGTFFGTSAAAPAAAAIASLVKSQNPGFTPTQIRTALLASALDIEAPGVDRDSGAGIVMASPPQPGCTFSTGATIHAGTNGGIVSPGVNASSPSCNWMVFSNVPWVIVTNGAGAGNGAYSAYFQVNRGPARSGTLTMPGGPTVTLTQQGTAATVLNNSTPMPIADNTVQESLLSVGGLTEPIVNVSVSLFLTHTFDSDLVISLVAPDGTVVKLSDRNGTSGDNYGSACPLTSRTTFDDSAATHIVHGVPDFTGSFRPEQPLAILNGKAPAVANGTWKLRIEDTFAGEAGTLQCWALHFNHGPGPAVPTDFDGNGLSDLAVFRPATGQWFYQTISPQFGLPGDIPVPGDYQGAGFHQLAVYRPSTGQWFIQFGTPAMIAWGRAGDLPVPADYDGDGRTDTAVFRTTDGNAGVWFLNLPGQAPVQWGVRGDIPMPGDYDGDGLADLGLFRPGTGQWFILYAAGGFTTSSSVNWGLPGDIPIRADVDTDGRLDFVVYRPANGMWFFLPTNSPAASTQFGLPGDVPLMLELDNGDGNLEVVVWRPSTGQWFFRSRTGGTTYMVPFGLPGDIPVATRPELPSTPVSDFDGDGASDITVFRPSIGTWLTRTSSSGFVSTTTTAYGLPGDIRVNGDYDGDHRTDVAVYRPGTRQWLILQSTTGTERIVAWGLAGDRPMPADYDGDGRTDIAVWRPSTGEWLVINSSTGLQSPLTILWGVPGDDLFARDFDGDGRADFAAYRPSTFEWLVKLTTTPFGPSVTRIWGMPGDIPMPGDFDGDGRTEMAIYRPSDSSWLGIDALTGIMVINTRWGVPGDTAQPHDFDGDGVDDATVFRPSEGTWYIRRSSNFLQLRIPWGLPSDQPVVRIGGSRP